jgi:hypothetical protein
MDGNVVAIKTFKEPRPLGWEHMLAHGQLVLASKLRHQNIVKVLGYGHEVETQKSSVIMRLLKHKNRPAKGRGYFWVEEYVPNGTLYSKIHGKFPVLRYSYIIVFTSWPTILLIKFIEYYNLIVYFGCFYYNFCRVLA